MPKVAYFTEEMGNNIFVFQLSSQRDYKHNIGKITNFKKPNVKKTIRRQRLGII